MECCDVSRQYLSVDDLVSAQSAGLSESFAAYFANEGSRPGVDRHVSGQVVMSVKNLWTISKLTE